MKEKVLVSICLALLILVATSTPIMAEQIYWLRGVNPIAADKALVKEALAYKEAGNWDAWDAMANRKVFFFLGYLSVFCKRILTEWFCSRSQWVRCNAHTGQFVKNLRTFSRSTTKGGLRPSLSLWSTLVQTGPRWFEPM